MLLEISAKFRLIIRRLNLFEGDHLHVAPRGEGGIGVVHISYATRHARAEVDAGFAQADDTASSHVFTPMVTDALDNGESARIPHAKTLTRLAAEERGARSGPIAGDVADDDIVLGHEPALHQLGAGVHHNLATREALAAAVVGVALDLESNAAGEREAEGLARVTAHEHIDSAIREALAAVALRHLIGQHGADSAVKIVQRLLQRDLRARCERGGGLFDQLVVKDGVEPGRVFGKVVLTHDVDLRLAWC
mmetsp:Transcript_700/g.2427  ORF Transcript_700/g.2427 Transcript_700/m.2427 type:complete len:250 (+) Transcript_700:791-1540(+)